MTFKRLKGKWLFDLENIVSFTNSSYKYVIKDKAVILAESVLADLVKQCFLSVKCFGWQPNVLSLFTITETSSVLELECVLFCVLLWWVFMCTCGMCPVEVGAPVDSRARLQCRPGPSCLQSGPPEPQLCNTSTDQILNLNRWILLFY